MEVEVERGAGADYREWFQGSYGFANNREKFVNEPEQKVEEWKDILEENGIWVENEPTEEPKITL